MRSSSVPATKVAEHLTWLINRYGATHSELAEAAGVDERTIRHILDADPDRGVHRRTAHRIFDLRTMPIGRRLVDARPTRRRAEALSAIGWSRSEVARRAGVSVYALHPSKLNKTVWYTTDRALASAYEELRGRPRLTAAGDMPRKVAQRLGYAPPWAWPKGSIDDPRARPAFDQIDNATWRAAVRLRYMSTDI